MASSGDQWASKAKNPRVLLQFSCDTLRIPDELAAEIGAGQALVVCPSGTGGKVKVWPVEVGRDGGGAFLGSGWPEFAEASGVEAGWLLVLRHRGRGVLTVKAFDASRCLRVLGATTPPEVEATVSSRDDARKQQFISAHPTNFMEKMLIPAKFVQQYLPKEHLNNQSAIVLGPIGKVHSIKLEMGQSDLFFAGGWSQFLAFHDITEANALLLRYEGNMVFTVKIFGPNGCPIESKHKEVRVPQNIEEQQEAPSASIQKCCENDLPISDGEKKPQGSITSLKKASPRVKCIYKIGPPAWIRKEMSTKTIRKYIVHVLPYKGSSHQLGSGWRRFCQENKIKEGDVCTFNIIDSTLWHVVIARR
ncbi:putative B3 domain-containing protein Os04g0347400 isoform X4 [Setaria italica]|uniref:putative B3 domain-containing protein Os04g0347400 isoform X4 n=1 Tax=Setaria italica TaxID=4555 RepID=UPI000BE4B3F2|nr:putative B3 domain-containing protein Os04g0347400 isoform X4 [Setaria italica]